MHSIGISTDKVDTINFIYKIHFHSSSKLLTQILQLSTVGTAYMHGLGTDVTICN